MNQEEWRNIITFYIQKQNVTVEELELLHRIREIPGSNLGTETYYPD
jgi:hypothetical protein